MGKLTDRAVRSAKPGRHSDGKGLMLLVRESGARSWVLRYQVDGKRRDHGLGSYPELTLADAREAALAARRLVRKDHKDPIDERCRERDERRRQKAAAMTFKACADLYIAAHEPSWRNPKHRQQWKNTLSTYVHPVVGNLPVAAVDTDLVMKILDPIWQTRPETAGRVRGRIEAILGWATVRKYRQGDNPARWRGHLDHLLPQKGKISTVKHHAALPWGDAPAFMAELRQQPGTAARCLEFTILTWTRTGESIAARPQEFDLAARTWAIPSARMKADKAHVVPLSEPAIAILRDLDLTGDFVFPGGKRGKHLSNMAMAQLLKRMGRDDVTVHGMRSCAKDWAAEATSHPDIVSEMALAHTIPDKVQKAYRRGDLLAKRKKLMEHWARFLTTPPTEKVVDLAALRA